MSFANAIHFIFQGRVCLLVVLGIRSQHINCTDYTQSNLDCSRPTDNKVASIDTSMPRIQGVTKPKNISCSLPSESLQNQDNRNLPMRAWQGAINRDSRVQSFCLPESTWLQVPSSHAHSALSHQNNVSVFGATFIKHIFYQITD